MSGRAHGVSYTDARMWGRQAAKMGLTLEQAIEDIQQCGCPDYLLDTVRHAYICGEYRAVTATRS